VDDDGCPNSCKNAPFKCAQLVPGYCGSAQVPGSGGASCGLDVSKMFKIYQSGADPTNYVFATNHSENNVECPYSWGTSPDPAYGWGLAVMRGRIEDYFPPTGSEPDNDTVQANKIEIILNDQGSVSKALGSQLASGDPFFIMPNCAATNTGFKAAYDASCYRSNTAPPPVSKTCTVSASAANVPQGEPLTLTISGGADFASSDVVRLYVEKTDFTEINPAPNPAEFPNPAATGETNPYESGGNYYYQIPAARCNSTGPGTCSGTATISSLPAGVYNFHCDVHHAEPDTLKCSGNPYCEGKWTTDCAGWTSCSNTDNVGVTIDPPILNISGTVYEGIGTAGISYCNEEPGKEWAGGTGMDISLTGLLQDPNPVGPYAVAGDTGIFESGVIQPNSSIGTISLNNLPTDYTITCPANGEYAIDTTNLAADVTGVNFFISQVNSPWWQARGGLIHGENSIVSNLPYVDDPPTTLTAQCQTAGSGCVPYLITADVNGGDTITSGIPTGGAFDLYTRNYPSQLDLGNGVTYASGHSNAGVTQTGYAQLSSRFDLTTATDITPSPGNSLTNQPISGDLQVDVRVYKITEDVRILDTDWQITEDTIIFVDGSVIFDSTAADPGPFIRVDSGVFFAVIASGNITFSETIGYNIASTPNIYITDANFQGIYVANGTLTIANDSVATNQDLKFVGAGSFVGLTGVSLPRNFEAEGDSATGLANNSVPTETFIFRPDFVLNTPELMKKSTFTWQEINALD